MLRTLGVLVLALSGLLVIATGGQVGPVDLAELPPSFFALAGGTVLFHFALRYVDA